MPAKLGNVEVEASLGKQRGDFRAQSVGGEVLFIHCISQNVPNLLFHAPAIPPGSPLQANFDPKFDVPYYELSHDSLRILLIS
jgi:hypothetical protein